MGGGKGRLRWRNFEDEVFRRVKKVIRDLLSGSAQIVFHRAHRRYSSARGADVAFEVMVEVWKPGQAEPFLRWAWECKDYPRRKVSVNDVEVFADQLHQTAVQKGTIVTRIGFTAAAIRRAHAAGIGLALLAEKLEAVTYFDADPPHPDKVVEILFSAPFVLYSNGRQPENKLDWHLDAYIQAELRLSGFAHRPRD